jgi:hypothetical protein
MNRIYLKVNVKRERIGNGWMKKRPTGVESMNREENTLAPNFGMMKMVGKQNKLRCEDI